MDWFTDLFTQHSAIQAVVVLSLISVFGMMLGKVRFFGISLGVTFVFFIGIAAGHFGLSVDPSMLAFAESFGLVLFVYALGLQVGPGFFSSLRSGGIRLVSLATLIVLTGSALAVGLLYSSVVAASCLELKDKLKGGYWDWIDWIMTAVGGGIAAVVWLFL